MANWKFDRKQLSESVHHFRILDELGQPLSYDQVLDLWCDDSKSGKSFRRSFTQCLCDCPFIAFRWETPVVDLKRLTRDFEFVLLNATGLDRRESASAFREHFEKANARNAKLAAGELPLLTLQFPNIGGNAVMVVPMPTVADQAGTNGVVNHCHLASFLRTASDAQTDDFWIEVGDAMHQRVSDKPVWLSTAGGGVAWLHARLDNRPKYYGYQPFKSA